MLWLACTIICRALSLVEFYRTGWLVSSSCRLYFILFIVARASEIPRRKRERASRFTVQTRTTRQIVIFTCRRGAVPPLTLRNFIALIRWNGKAMRRARSFVWHLVINSTAWKVHKLIHELIPCMINASVQDRTDAILSNSLIRRRLPPADAHTTRAIIIISVARSLAFSVAWRLFILPLCVFAQKDASSCEFLLASKTG